MIQLSELRQEFVENFDAAVEKNESECGINAL